MLTCENKHPPFFFVSAFVRLCYRAPVLTDVRCTVRVIVKDLAKEGTLDEKQRRSLKMQKPPDVYGHITYLL